LTAHRQAAVVWTMTCWLPAVVWGVTAEPDAAVDVTAGVEPGDPPALTVKIWNEGPPAGAGAHWKAQPMFHVPPAMVKAGLVQLPVCCVSGTSTVAGPTDAAPVVVVESEVPAAPAGEAPAAVVLVLLAAVVVGLELAPAAVELPAWAVELLGGGNL
jgi:hypothetical protein